MGIFLALEESQIFVYNLSEMSSTNVHCLDFEKSYGEKWFCCRKNGHTKHGMITSRGFYNFVVETLCSQVVCVSVLLVVHDYVVHEEWTSHGNQLMNSFWNCTVSVQCPYWCLVTKIQ